MLPHSEFVAEMQKLSRTLLPDFKNMVPLADVIRLSRAGVNPEGGEIPQEIVVVAPRPRNTGFKFGDSSMRKAEGVHADLVLCAIKAIEKYSLIDFGIFEGLRTRERQRKLVRDGKSRTMQSKHIDGLALDLVPWIKGGFVWEWDGCAKIAFAMDQAATELGIAHRITWGGAWDRKLSDYGGRLEDYMLEVERYKVRHAGSDFIDGPHFQFEP